MNRVTIFGMTSIIILLLLFSSVSVFAGGEIVDSYTAATHKDNYYGYNALYNWTCVQYISSASYNLATVSIDVSQDGLLSGNQELYLRDTTANGAILATSLPVAETTFPTWNTFAYVNFTFSPAVAVTQGATYYLCTHADHDSSIVGYSYWMYNPGAPSGTTYFDTAGDTTFIYNYIAYNETAACIPSWSCSDFGACNMSNVTPCLNVTDANICGIPFNGTLSDYDENCSYVPTSNLTVTPISPANHSHVNVSNATVFTYTAQDGVGTNATCSLNLNGLDGAPSVVPMNTTQNATGAVNAGSNSWFVNCSDSLTTVQSLTWIVIGDVPSPPLPPPPSQSTIIISLLVVDIIIFILLSLADGMMTRKTPETNRVFRALYGLVGLIAIVAVLALFL